MGRKERIKDILSSIELQTRELGEGRQVIYDKRRVEGLIAEAEA